ncbi:MAG TPA: class I SAM-dependent methyltransferase [Myxococcota bacterium]|jgi:ubiquinone/menaquinone biosynthesis C-methylase UbiE
MRIEPAGGDTATPLNLRKRLAWIERFASPLAKQRVLDCGCGAGEYVRALLARGADAYGVEFDEAKLAGAAARGADLAERLSVGDLEALAFPDASFDAALLNEVLEHVPDDAAALAEVARVLRPGGRLILLSPTRLYPFETHGVFWRASGRRVPHTVPGIPWLPLALGTKLFTYWARNYWPWELRALVERAGLRVIATGAVWQTFENISGRQPGWLTRITPLLRALCGLCERIPGLRAFGVSQLIVAEKP